MNLKRTLTLKSYKINPIRNNHDLHRDVLDTKCQGISNGVKVGITMGDPSGVGPEIVSKAVQRLKGILDFVIIGDKWVFDKLKTHNSQLTTHNFIDLKNVSHNNFSFGKIKPAYGRASMEYLDKAIELIENRQIDCLVTSPISKEAWRLAGFNYAGHTEYLAEHSNTNDFVMMLLNKHLKIALVTRHVPLKNVSSLIRQDKLYKTIFITYHYLKNIFLIKEPRIVVCALNPHASDNGLIGNEENRIIKPVLSRFKGLIRYIDGPLSSDIAISKAAQKEYDCVIAMYHDQALIPLKLLDKDTGVNITLGLPFIRTSPLHGSAFDIAGTQKANPNSMIQAIKIALRCALNLRKV